MFLHKEEHKNIGPVGQRRQMKQTLRLGDKPTSCSAKKVWFPWCQQVSSCARQIKLTARRLGHCKANHQQGQCACDMNHNALKHSCCKKQRHMFHATHADPRKNKNKAS